ncbi:hypothetical protein CC80DRAFT_429572 [Byssothecium circinans]|uniref:COP9 signalosome complex subunit 3 N-terminal helical repeats domain-containing protein n=1 Tax=Byssothecium circinans TaxID=147558 RepID=A0A6A5TEW6_9PLEO|nr:hypothetical protein CC80DRAFT_429572 [Byssothecium circinans]
MSGELLNVLLGFQPQAPELRERREYDKHAREFLDALHKIAPSYFLKGADTPQDILNVLDPTTNSIAYAVTLRLRIQNAIDRKATAPLQPGNSLWNSLVLFLESFDPVQMRYAGIEYKRLVEYVEQIARGVGSPALAIAPIRSAMLRLDPTTGCFTCTHLSFVRLCLETRSYTAAVPILDNYIHSLPSAIQPLLRDGTEYSVPCADSTTSGEFIHTRSGHSEKITLADVQEYYLLGAMAYMGARQFKHAHQLLEHALVVPTANVANGLMLEAYKKWLVLGCLVNNKSAKQTPRTANSNAMKQVRNAAKAYEALVDAFSQFGNLLKLKAQVAAGHDMWAEDGNAGLVDELVQHQSRSFVSRLSRTFSAIPVSNIATSVGGNVDDTTAFVETLIRDGFLNARLERNDKPEVGAVLRFSHNPTQGPLAKSEKQQQQALLEQTQRTNALAEQVKDADFRLSITKEYAEYVRRQNKKASGGSADAMDMGGWGDEDEDMMSDLR